VAEAEEVEAEVTGKCTIQQLGQFINHIIFNAGPELKILYTLYYFFTYFHIKILHFHTRSSFFCALNNYSNC